MSQTKEIRIRLHYRSLKRWWGRDLGSKGRLFLHLSPMVEASGAGDQEDRSRGAA